MNEVTIEPAKIIERLGGNAKTAVLCEVTRGAISQWLHNGIPKAQLKFLKLARPDAFQDLSADDMLQLICPKRFAPPAAKSRPPE